MTNSSLAFQMFRNGIGVSEIAKKNKCVQINSI